MKKIFILFIIMGIILELMPSCKKLLLDAGPETNSLSVKNSFKTNDDALTAFNGCYASMQGVVDQIYIAGEMQGELVVATRGCDSIPYLKQILNNYVTPVNPYTDYSSFYKIVATCNSAINGYANLCKVNPSFSSDLRDLYTSHAILIRSWAYLQLVKIWGDVPYISNTVFDIDSIKDVAASPANEILNKIADDINSQLYMSDIWFAASYTTDKFIYSTSRMLLAEVNLWNGKYVEAYDAIKKFLPFLTGPYFTENGAQPPSNTFYSYFDSWRYPGPAWITRYNFSTSNANPVAAQFIPFDGSREQKNSIVRWTNNQGNSIYAIKPSSWAIKNWAVQDRDSLLFWMNPMTTGANQVQSPNKEQLKSLRHGDWIRGGGGIEKYGNSTYTVTAGSYLVDGNDTVIYKPSVKTATSYTVTVNWYGTNITATIYNLTRRSAFNNDNYTNDDLRFNMWGEGWIQLWCAEILNQIGRSREALSILNTRGGNLSSIRRRVGLYPVLTEFADVTKRQVDDVILNEMSLESAFEGYRWFDLVRFSKRYNDPSIIANAIAKKHPVYEQGEIIARLSDPNRWFYPYYYKNVLANKKLIQKAGY
jgi:hypothetical protein